MEEGIRQRAEDGARSMAVMVERSAPRRGQLNTREREKREECEWVE